MTENGEVQVEQKGFEFYAPLTDVKVEKGFNLRSDLNSDPEPELVNSVRENGVLMPITVRRRDGKKGLWIVDGHRRYRAAKRTKQKSVPVHIAQIDDSVEATVFSLTTKTQRPFTDGEVAAGYHRLVQNGCTPEEVAKLIGCHPRSVVEAVRIMEKATEKLKAANAPTRVLSRAATLDPVAQNDLAEKVDGKSRTEGLKAVREKEKELGVTPRGRKVNEYPLVKKPKEILEELEGMVLRKLDASKNKDPYYKGMRDAVDIMKGSQTLDSVFGS